MLNIDTKQVAKYERDLKRFKFSAYPHATKATINGATFKAKGFAQENIRNGMVLRNRFTERSVQVEQSRTLTVDRQSATVGSTEDYMETQEFGGSTKRRGANQTVIPTSYSAGQGRGVRPRTRLPTRANRMANIRLDSKLKSKAYMSRRQRAFLTGLLAANAGQKHVFIPAGDDGTSEGIYRVFGKAKRKGRFTRIRMEMVYRMKPEATRIPASPWLLPAVDRTQPEMPALYRDALRAQLRRHNLF